MRTKIVLGTLLALLLTAPASRAEWCDVPEADPDPTVDITCYEHGCAVEWDGVHYVVHCAGAVNVHLEGDVPR